MKIIALSQEDANDLLVLITSDALGVKASAVNRVHQLQVALAQETSDFVAVAEVQKELDEVRARRPHWDGLGAELEAMKSERDAALAQLESMKNERNQFIPLAQVNKEHAEYREQLAALTKERDAAYARGVDEARAAYLSAEPSTVTPA